MKHLKILFLISILLFCTKLSYAYEKLDFFDLFHVYTPYIYITQDDTTIEEARILVLFHDYTKAKNKNSANTLMGMTFKGTLEFRYMPESFSSLPFTPLS